MQRANTEQRGFRHFEAINKIILFPVRLLVLVYGSLSNLLGNWRKGKLG